MSVFMALRNMLGPIANGGLSLGHMYYFLPIARFSAVNSDWEG
jgi:hypothetical protein